MPASFNYEEIKQQMERLAEILEKTLVSKIIQTSEESDRDIKCVDRCTKRFLLRKRD